MTRFKAAKIVKALYSKHRRNSEVFDYPDYAGLPSSHYLIPEEVDAMQAIWDQRFIRSQDQFTDLYLIELAKLD